MIHMTMSGMITPFPIVNIGRSLRFNGGRSQSFTVGHTIIPLIIAVDVTVVIVIVIVIVIRIHTENGWFKSSHDK